MAKSKDKTLLQKMQEICPYHIAKYVQWYLSDKKKRCKWDETICNDPQVCRIVDLPVYYKLEISMVTGITAYKLEVII